MPSKRRHGHAITTRGPYEKHKSPSYVPEFKTPEKFAEKKIEMLQKDFRIDLSDEDISRLKSLKTERAINTAVRTIIDRSWR